jgi:hypothetical protein
MHYIKLLLSIIATTCLASCGNAGETVQLNTEIEGKPAIWKVTGPKADIPELAKTGSVKSGTAYLFGTIHTLPKNIEWSTPILETAIGDSDELIIEVVGLEDKKNSAKIFTELALSPNLPKVEARIKPSLHDELDRVLDDANIAELTLNRMESWAAALSLATAQTGKLGLSSDEGVEKKLIAKFEGLKKPVSGLETIAQQLGYFDKLPESEQREMLTSVLEESGDTKEAFQELFDAWYTGDIIKLEKLTEGGILEKPEIRERILVARNKDWDEQLHEKLKQPGTLFVAVGAAHLVGPDAVQLMLEARGYSIQKIQ